MPVMALAFTILAVAVAVVVVNPLLLPLLPVYLLRLLHPHTQRMVAVIEPAR